MSTSTLRTLQIQKVSQVYEPELSGCTEPVLSVEAELASGSSRAFLGRKPLRSSGSSCPKPQQAGCHGWRPEGSQRLHGKRPGLGLWGHTCHHKAQNNLLPLASFPCQRPELVRTRAACGEPRVLSPLRAGLCLIIEDSPHQWFGPEVHPEGL